MYPYRLCTLYSGSTGNAAYLETPHARILIDAGKCAKTLIASLSAVGVPVDSLDAVIITHDHHDHVAALEVLAKKHPIPVHMMLESAMIYRRNPPEALCSCFVLHKDPHDRVTVGDVTINAFPTPHDSRASIGFRFDLPDGTRIGYATDIGHVSREVHDNLLGCESVVLESNHDVEMLFAGPYPYDLKLRIRSTHGHLSNRDCADFAAELASHGTGYILLAHLSEQNNYPDLAFDETASAIAGTGADLRIASPTEVTMLVGDADKPIPKTPLDADCTRTQEVTAP